MKKYQAKYWSNKGKFQKQYNELYDKLVPEQGESETTNGEIIRIVSRLYYDIFNNGGCNFSVYRKWRIDLVNIVPPNMRQATIRFTSYPPSDLWEESRGNYNNYLKFLDLYVDWAVMYVASQESLEKLENKMSMAAK